MPRKPRVEYAGALYHVISRGDRGEVISRDDADREMFLKTLGEACAWSGWISERLVMGHWFRRRPGSLNGATIPKSIAFEEN